MTPPATGSDTSADIQPGLVLEPLYPDRLGEDFVALQTPGHGHQLAIRLHEGGQDLAAAGTGQAAVTVSRRLVEHDRHANLALLSHALWNLHMYLREIGRLNESALARSESSHLR